LLQLGIATAIVQIVDGLKLTGYAAMLEPPFNVNPVSRLWRMLDANIALAGQFPEYIKLAQIALVHVLGSVEDERCLSSLTFLKDKIRNRLASDHLSVVMGMHGQQVFTLENFPYDDCFQTWVQSAIPLRSRCVAWPQFLGPGSCRCSGFSSFSTCSCSMQSLICDQHLFCKV
jgi:hypothetical protein